MDKRYIKHVLLYLISGVLALIGIGYIAFHMSGGNASDLDSELCMLCEVDDKVEAKGVIFRSETVLAGAGGDVCGILRDGENAMAGQEVLWMFSEDSEGVGRQLKELEGRIRVLEDSLLAENVPSGLSTNSKELKEYYARFLSDLERADLSGMSLLLDALQTRINRGKNSLATENAIKASIAALEEERNRLIAEHENDISVLKTDLQGLFYSYTDGFEGICDLTTAENMDCAAFLALYDKVQAGEETGVGGGKIVTDPYWYVALTLPVSAARDMKLSQNYLVGFTDSEDVSLQMTLCRMDTDYEAGQSLLVFGSRSVPDGFDFARVQNLSIVKTTHKGFRVPLQAVRYVDGKTGVYVTDGNKVRFRRIEILFSKEGSYVVKQYDTQKEEYADMIRLYDKIVLSGKGLYDGKYLN